MTVPSFIASRISFKGRAVSISIAVSFLVIIVALAVSSGFRTAIRDSLAEVAGDISIRPVGYSSEHPLTVFADSALLEQLRGIEGIAQVRPCNYCAGILRNEGNVHGVMFKGVDTLDGIRIPRKLASLLSLSVGDKLPGYFINDRIAIRNLEIREIYDGIVTDDDKLVVFCSSSMLGRILLLEENEFSTIEIVFDSKCRGEAVSSRIWSDVSYLLYDYSEITGNKPLYAYTISSQYPQLFDWLNLIDHNVLFILVLMIIVAGFNMISGLLILLFQNISTIGLLKALGMNRREIAKVFLITGSKLVAKGMIVGNVAAFLLISVQRYTHLFKLNAENYFVSYLPVDLDITLILLCDVLAFAVILLIMLIPCSFISSVDPAKTIKTN